VKHSFAYIAEQVMLEIDQKVSLIEHLHGSGQRTDMHESMNRHKGEPNKAKEKANTFPTSAG